MECVLKIILDKEVWREIPNDVEAYEYLNGVEDYLNSLLDRKGSHVIITQDFNRGNFDFISYEDEYEFINEAFNIIEEDKQRVQMAIQYDLY